MAITPTRYFIGKTEVPESLWMSTPDSLKYSTLKIEYDSLTAIKSGIMPLNIVIGKDGVIKYIHSGKITAEEELSELRNAIISGL